MFIQTVSKKGLFLFISLKYIRWKNGKEEISVLSIKPFSSANLAVKVTSSPYFTSAFGVTASSEIAEFPAVPPPPLGSSSSLQEVNTTIVLTSKNIKYFIVFFITVIFLVNKLYHFIYESLIFS